MTKVNLESGNTLRLLANIGGSKRQFAEIYSAATGLKSGYQTLVNTLRASKGMTSKQVSGFLHNLRHCEEDSILQDYKDDLRYMYYLLDYFMESGVLDRDDDMRVDSMTPTEERQMERRFGESNGYEPTGNGNVEGLSDDWEEEAQTEDVAKESEDVQGEHQGDVSPVEEVDGETVKQPDIDDVLMQLLSFGQTKKQEEAPPSPKGNDFLSNFLAGSERTRPTVSVSSDEFDNDLANVPDVFDKDTKEF